MQQKNDEQTKEKIFDMIRDIRVALMATHSADGLGHARPMAAVTPGKDFDGTLWFFTPEHSRKVAEIEANPKVLLAYSEPSHQNYLSITGHAEITQDRAKIEELWSEHMRTWFPKGPSDPEIALIKVTAENAEYWDSPSSVLVYAYGYLKARLTGEPPAPGDVGQVKF